MHWNQIEKNWGEMTRRLQAASLLSNPADTSVSKDRHMVLPPDNSAVMARADAGSIAIEPTH